METPVIDDGGPAFARPLAFVGDTSNAEVEVSPDQPGMSLRDYFAAHAPTDIPDWFKHREPVKYYPDCPHWSTLPNEDHREIARSWIDDPCYDLPDELRWFQEKFEAYQDAAIAWREQDALERYIQWRWHYADAMLEARKPKAVQA